MLAIPILLKIASNQYINYLELTINFTNLC